MRRIRCWVHNEPPVSGSGCGYDCHSRCDPNVTPPRCHWGLWCPEGYSDQPGSAVLAWVVGGAACGQAFGDTGLRARLSTVTPGGGVPRGPGVQERCGGLPSCAGEAMDVLPEGTAELLCARGLPLLLQRAAGRDGRGQPGGPARGPCRLLHPQQQVSGCSREQTGEAPHAPGPPQL